MLKMLSIADLITLLNLVFGSVAVMVLISGINGNMEPVYLACTLILLGVMADGLDGKMARRFGKSSIGEDLDSLADAITFAVAPAILAFIQYRKDFRTIEPFVYNLVAGDILLGAVCVFIILCTILRLARFNQGGQVERFIGLPSPANALVVTTFMLFPPNFRPFWILLPLIVLLSVLMISDIEYPKIGRKTGAVASIIISALILILIFAQLANVNIEESPLTTGIIVILGLTFFISYITMGPVYWRKKNGD